jgi:hypothetical protein
LWTDPDGTFQGHAALKAQAQKLLDRFPPELAFSAAGPVQVSRNMGLLAFAVGAPEQPPTVRGVDVALVRDGRIAELHTLLE